MPSSSSSPGAIVHELGAYVAAAGIPAAALRRTGWFDFRSFDYPPEGDEIDVAAEALIYCGFGESGHWNNDLRFLSAILRYVKVVTGLEPTAQDLLDLRSLLASGRTAAEPIRDWFDRIYREPDESA